MKGSRILRTLAVAVILSLLVITLVAVPTRAVVRIFLTQGQGEVGSRIDVEGTGFRGSSETTIVDVYLYFSSDAAAEGDDIGIEVDTYKMMIVAYTTSGGGFTVSFKVPSELKEGDDDEAVGSGTYYVYAVYAGTTVIEAKAEFTVLGSEITINPSGGLVGTKVAITGEGFKAKESFTVKYGGVTINIGSGDSAADKNGKFTCTIFIPKSTAGKHTITVTGDSSGREAKADFTVKPQITISPETGLPGSKATATGTGFASGSKVTINFTGKAVATGKTDTYGSFEFSFDLPQMERGTYDVTAEDESGNKADAVKFTITAGGSLSPTSGNVGSDIIFSGVGFKAGQAVIIKYDATDAATTAVDSKGSFSATFKIPASKRGNHIITATDGTNTITATFVMESTPPAIPKPLLPLMDAKIKSPISFDWEDVDDPSGVTYTLQIASDKEFASIVLEKKNLTKSGYTLAQAEELKPTKKDAPYYWRIMAIDGASNESKWTTPGSFFIGGAGLGLKMPGWAIYALFGLGMLIFFLIGLWLGRRTAYY